MKMTQTQYHAMRALAQWDLGDPDHIDRLLGAVQGDDPKADVMFQMGDDKDAETVWRQARPRGELPSYVTRDDKPAGQDDDEGSNQA